MSEVTPELIKTLRERTGVGVGKCKQVLQEANGDIELAITNLRKEGMATAVKKQGREAKEGVIAVAESAQLLALVEVNAETDFVVKNERFQQFAAEIAQEVANSGPASLEAFLAQPFSKDPQWTVDQYRASLVQSIGENIQIRRFALLPKQPGHSLGHYCHLGNQVVTAVGLKGGEGEGELARAIAVHVAAAAPEYLIPEEVPPQILEQEREIAKVQMAGKPAYVLEKILEGKMSAFYDMNCLSRQKYMRDESLTITQLVDQQAKKVSKPLALNRFVRWCVGENLPSA